MSAGRERGKVLVGEWGYVRCSGGMEGAVLRRNVRHGEPGRYRGAQGKSNLLF